MAQVYRTFLFVGLIALAFSSRGWAKTLDDVVSEMKSGQYGDPFVVGPSRAKKNLLYDDLLRIAADFNTDVKWVRSVSASVRALPFHPDRMNVKASDEFDGWFDEYTDPNQIFVHNKAALIILIHELRHAVQLGSHGKIRGTWFDQLLQRSRAKIHDFQSDLSESSLSKAWQFKLRKSSQRLLETSSEISAHRGDLELSKAYKRPEAESYARFIKEYRAEFNRSLRVLRSHPFSKNQSFVNDLEVGLARLEAEE